MAFKTVNPLLTSKSKDMELIYFIGIDVSKHGLDFAIMQGPQLLFHRQLANKPSAIKAFNKELFTLPGFAMDKAVFCLEHTGIYNNYLLTFLHQNKAKICLQSASHIRFCLGNIRGKNDKIDAIRIAHYAYRQREELRFWQPKREVIERLAHLAATRSRLLAAQKLLKTPLQETAPFVSKRMAAENGRLCAASLKALKSDLASIDKAIDELIAADAELARLFSLVSSVAGVGKVTATQLIITTNEFKDISHAKKFAAYAGVAPYTHESGKYKGRARVSPMANKKIKTLLHLAAMTAIQYCQELKTFYERKVQLEKKNKMSVINAVRNKILRRIFACVNQNRKYEKFYPTTLA